MKTGRAQCLSSYEVERALHPDRWPDPLSADALAHAESCPQCRTLVNRASEEELKFQREVLPAVLPVLRDAVSGQRTRTRVRWSLVAVAAAAAIAVLVLSDLREEAKSTAEPAPLVAVAPAPGPPPYDGIKSTVGLGLFVKRGDDVFRHEPGTPLHPGDAIRFLPLAPHHDYLLVLHIGATGEVEVAYPWQGTASGRLPKPGKATKGAAKLDEKLGNEVVVAFYSDSPVAAFVARLWVHGQSGRPESGKVRQGGQVVEVVVLEYVKEAP